MLAAFLYLLLLCAMLWFSKAFGMYRDEHLSGRQLAFIFLLKALAVPVYFIIHQDRHGSLRELDTGKFYHDIEQLHSCAKSHPGFYFRTITGLNDPNADHPCLNRTENWKDGTSEKFFYQDNRLLIRVHSLLHFISFHSWFVHALFSCFFSFTGLFLFYRSIKKYLPSRPSLFFVVICFIPSLWLYSGALLKEGLLLLVLGCGAWALERLFSGRRNAVSLLILFTVILLSLYLKPYFLVTSVFHLAAFYWLRQYTAKRAVMTYMILVVASLSSSNYATTVFRGKTLTQIAVQQQRTFAGAAKGGIFLVGDTSFLRLEYDTTLIQRSKTTPDHYRIRAGVPYMAWHDSHHEDTIYVKANADTITEYRLAFMSPASRSNFSIPELDTHPVQALTSSAYHALFYPFFWNSSSLGEIIYSIENLLILIAVILIAVNIKKPSTNVILAVTSIGLFLLLAVVICYTAPNSGAVFRYRSPLMPFLVTSLFATSAGKYQFKSARVK